MASGIDWFRWHHGSVTDPKFQLVAKKANASFGDVIAVWAFILESASASDDRGTIGDIDFESIDCLLNSEEGTTERIIECMRSRGLINSSRICSWEKRQPKREDDTAAERKRRQRERDQELKMAGYVTDEVSRNEPECHADVTTSHADVTHCHDREEKRREEVNHGSDKPTRKKATALPADFYPNESGVAYAEEKRISMAVELESFRNWHQAKGGTFKDWQACWRTWCDKAVEFGRTGKSAAHAALPNGQASLPDFMRGAI